jgi:hypothetical protein
MKQFDITWDTLDEWVAFRNEALMRGIWVTLVANDDKPLSKSVNTKVQFKQQRMSFETVDFVTTEDGTCVGIAVATDPEGDPLFIMAFDKHTTVFTGSNIEANGEIYIGAGQ